MRREMPLVVSLFAILGCGGNPGAEKAPPAPASVIITQPTRQSLARIVEQPGTVQPYEETQLQVRITGYVAVLNADIGKKVKEGEVLAELSVPDMVQEGKEKDAQVKRALAEVKQAEKALASAKANAKAASAVVEEARAGLTRTEALKKRWSSESDRVNRLVGQGILDQQTADETLNQYRAAQAAHNEVLARVTSAREMAAKAATDEEKAVADLDAAQARVDVTKADAGRMQALLGYAKIVAPYDGIVTRRRVNTGDFVQPTTGKLEGLFAVARLNPVRLVINVPEADAGLVTEKCPVKLAIPALKGPPIQGKVDRTSWSLDPGSRTLRVEIDHPNTDDRLRPGMYVYAHLTEQLPEAWTVPVTAVVKQGDNMVVFLVDDDKVARATVQVGHSDGKRIELLRIQPPGSPLPKEVTGDEKIATTAAGLTDGAQVTIKP
jgi:RND family efflux transporter MFP subunit